MRRKYLVQVLARRKKSAQEVPNQLELLRFDIFGWDKKDAESNVRKEIRKQRVKGAKIVLLKKVM